MSFATIEPTIEILELRNWILRRSEYQTTKDGLKTLCRKIFNETGIKFDGRWGERNLLEHVHAFLGAVAFALSKEVEDETELPEDAQTATVSRVAGRLAQTETFLTPFVELTEVSRPSKNLTDPGFPLTKKLLNLDLKVGNCITFTARISNSNGCFVHPKIFKIERPNSTTKITKVLRLSKPLANALERKSERPVIPKRLPNTYERTLLAKFLDYLLPNRSELVHRSLRYV
ncbi:MAG: hypothetical protein AAF349_06695 [Cyanobacteria bacterium P01_A01_bin.68]